jgi:hypothetical protein
MGVWMWVDSEGKIDPTSNGILRGTCSGAARDKRDTIGRWKIGRTKDWNKGKWIEENPQVKRVLISPAPAGGWPGKGVYAWDGCNRNSNTYTCPKVHVVQDRCGTWNGAIVDPRHSKCRYDFETKTFIDEDGNRWDTSEYNKLAD